MFFEDLKILSDESYANWLINLIIGILIGLSAAIFKNHYYISAILLIVVLCGLILMNINNIKITIKSSAQKSDLKRMRNVTINEVDSMEPRASHEMNQPKVDIVIKQGDKEVANSFRTIIDFDGSTIQELEDNLQILMLMNTLATEKVFGREKIVKTVEMRLAFKELLDIAAPIAKAAFGDILDLIFKALQDNVDLTIYKNIKGSENTRFKEFNIIKLGSEMIYICCFRINFGNLQSASSYLSVFNMSSDESLTSLFISHVSIFRNHWKPKNLPNLINKFSEFKNIIKLINSRLRSNTTNLRDRERALSEMQELKLLILRQYQIMDE